MIKCPGCGSALQFDPASQKLVCGSCSGSYDPEAFRDYPYTEKATEGKNVFDVTAWKCPNCGAELVSTDDKAASFCSYCGSNVLLESQISRLEYPKKIIPFKITKDDAEKSYKRRLSASLYAPSALRKAASLDRFRGIYMPYWSYDLKTEDHVVAGGSREHRRGDYVITDHYRIEADVEGSYESAYFDASSKYSDDLSRAVKPFQAEETIPFSPAYLSGFYADAGDVTKSVYSSDAKALADSYFDREAVSDRDVRKYNAESSVKKAVRPTSSQASISMFPVWFMSCRTDDNKRISYAAINGQTGKVAADVPIDFKKYVFGSLLLAVPIFLLLTFFFTLTPGKAMLTSIVLNVIGMILLSININKASERESRLNDKGYLSRLGKEEKAVITARKAAREKKKAKGQKRAVGAVNALFIVVCAFFVAPVLLSVLIKVIEVVYYLAREETLLLIITVLACAAAVLLIRMLLLPKKKKDPDNAPLPAPDSSEKKADQEQTVGANKVLILSFPFVGILICAGVFLFKPVEDFWYYGATILSILLMLASIYQIIRFYNIRTTHKLPQLLSWLLIGALSFGLFSLTGKPVNAASDYQILIDDRADLLTDEEEAKLREVMAPINEYGHAGFVTVSENSTSTASFSRAYYHEKFSTQSGTIFVIDMDNRMIYLFSDGSNYAYITDTKAESITDNVYRLASKEAYYDCAAQAFEQVFTVLNGGKIAEPMKHISNVLLALLISFLSNFLIVDFMSRQRPASDSALARAAVRSFSMSNVQTSFTGSTKRYDPISSSDDSGSSGGGGGGGGGGGSSGGGGGHSF